MGTQTEKKTNAIAKETVKNLKESKEAVSTKDKIQKILAPQNAKARITKLETFKVIAEKHERVTNKYDELTRFMASGDNTSGQLKFATSESYSFTIKNPSIVNEVLLLIESKLNIIVEETEKEVLNFSI